MTTPAPAAHQAKRSQILHAVWAVVAEAGPAAVSVRRVAAAAGVSAGRVQYYFPTRDALVRASVTEMIVTAESLHDSAADGAGADPAGELWDLLAHPLPRAREATSGTSVYFSFVAAGVADPEIARILAGAKSQAEQEVRRLLEQLSAPGDPGAGARELLAIADGLLLRVFVGSLATADAESTLRSAITRVVGRPGE